MGMRPKKTSSCGCSSNFELKERIAGNPDPRNFEIRETLQVKENLVVMVRYPNCGPVYQANKIMVFKNLTEVGLSELDFLDPHFCDSKEHISPIARFEPTRVGWYLAIKTALNLAEMTDDTL